MKQAEVYHKIVPKPQLPKTLTTTAKWLSGEGCGSWFTIEASEKGYLIARYSPEGKAECRGIFLQVTGNEIDLHTEFEFTYLSHCAEVNIIQDNTNLKFKLISKTI